MTTFISITTSSEPYQKYFDNCKDYLKLENCNTCQIFNNTKVFINGKWIGLIMDKSTEILSNLKSLKRIGFFNIYSSILYQKKKNLLLLFTFSFIQNSFFILF